MELSVNPSHSLQVTPVKTRTFKPGEDLAEFVLESLQGAKIEEETVLAVTSKIVSLSENRLVHHEGPKAELIRRESDHYFGEVGYGCHLTIKHGLFIPSAGIDESNSETGGFILYPEDPFQSACRLWERLRREWRIERLGILITDSHTTPLRRGVTGISLSHWGFQAVKNLVGTPDLFGRPLKVTTVNAADALASAAVYMMGEGNESQPLALLEGASVRFTRATDPKEVQIPYEDDLYSPLFKKTLC
jgi:F420-0:gamma-glutamyl ligase